MDYYENGGSASAKLFWKRPGQTTTQVIPQTQLYPAAVPTSTLLSQGKNAVASSLEDSSLTASNAVDSSDTTRWSSGYSDPQWIYVDLGVSKTVTQVKLLWETAAGKDYKIQSAPNGATNFSNDSAWTDIPGGTVTGNTAAGWKTFSSLSVAARYVRMKGTARATPYGYSLFSFQVWGY